MSSPARTEPDKTRPRILIIEDVEDDAALLVHALRRAGLQPVHERVDTPQGIQAAMSRAQWDVVLADHNVPGMDFATMLRLSRAGDPALPVIVVSGSIGEERAVELMRQGVADLVLKGNLARLAPAIARELAATQQQRARREADERFHNIAEITGEWLWETDTEHRFTFFSSAVERSGWFDAAAALGKRHWEIHGAVPDGKDWEQHKQDVEARRPFRDNGFTLVSGGERHHLTASGVPFYDSWGNWCGYRGMARDDTPIIEAYRRAEAAEALLRDAVESISEGFVIVDAADRFVMVNEAYRAFHPDVADFIKPGAPFEEFVKAAIRRGVYPDAIGNEVEWLANRMGDHRRRSGSSVHRLKGDRWIMISERPMRNGGSAGLRMDITALKAAEAERDYLAFHDRTTGLPNQLLFSDRLGQALAQLHGPQVVAVLSIELTSLTDIRDSQGLEAGEAALRETGQRIQAALPPGGTVAHFGNGHYLAFSIEPEGDAKVLDSVDRALAASMRSFRYDGVDVPLRIVVGISTAPADGTQPEELIRTATTALNEVKSNPLNGYRFYRAEMTRAAIHRWNIEADLRRAIDRKELLLHYQPQVDARSHRITGVEALVRWAHPDRGPIQPGQFIPIAEQTGLIVPLGEYVLRLACTEALAWRNDHGTALPIAVNLSPAQLAARDLDDVILSILNETRMPPERLKLELTESAILSDVAAATRTMRKLSSAGIRFALDDFGMEHSSLSHLSRLPIDTLKVDYAFVSQMTEDRAHAALVQAIIAMTHSLGMTAIAEGVERMEQLTYLQAYGCDAVQGFLFSRPLPVAAMPSTIAAGAIAPVPQSAV
ncbi:MAG TPA: EAL domain-containing protein [Devosiaceae bacterium]|nr:EAL domain-containing protein [Devosiaceae bacterium]